MFDATHSKDIASTSDHSARLPIMMLFAPRPTLIEKWLRVTACILSVMFVLMFFYVALRRINYPFELDRMESAMMTTVWRLVHGHPLYAPPTMEWVSFLYAPLFFYLSAALCHVTGLGYGTLRLVSILATGGSFGTIYAFLLRETRTHTVAIISVGIFASMYDLSIGWYDIARVDSLSVFFFLLAMYATRFSNPLIAALVWLLAFHSKQTFLPFGVLGFVPLWRSPRRMLTGMTVFTLLAWVSIRLLNHFSAGWYSNYAFGTTTQLSFIPRAAILFLPMDIFQPLPLVVTLIFVAAIIKPPSLRSSTAAFYGILTVLLVGAIGFVRAHGGANINAVIPAYAWLSILGGLAIHRILVWSVESVGRCPKEIVPIACSVVWLAVCVQLAGHIYQPARWIPSKATLAERQALIEAVSSTPGDVWLVNHSYDGILAGKPSHPEMDALDAVLGSGYVPVVAQFNQMIEEQHFSAILLDRRADTYNPPGVFTSPTFQSAYGLRAVVAGTEQQDIVDQPRLSYLPCADLEQNAIPLLRKGSFEDVTQCASKLAKGMTPPSR